MILRKLSIFGFKSFAEKTELEFGTGMTAVIGPNGCGKSNVVDAIRWVLGEQKVTLLRSTAMQDVIFSGTQKRQPLNMAEVVLTIENNKGILPVEYSEVSISRRIFRNGESEYRLNKVPCRLRDIHNLFLDTGVGSSAYTTIERGMIDSILSDKAEERRILFEEAAGIGKYKQRRRESLRQLDKTRQDLLRINDQVQEVDRQVRMLARHVEKARRYKTYRDDLKALELGYWKRQFRVLGETLAARRCQLDEMIDSREKARAKIAAEESRIETMKLSALEKEKDLEAASRSVSEANEKIIRLDRDLSVTTERLKSLTGLIAGIERDVAAIDTQIEENDTLKIRLEKCAIERESELLKFDERRDSINADLNQFDGRLQSTREDADALSREQIGLINSIGESRNALNALKASLANSIEQRSRAMRESTQTESRIEEYREAVAACQDKLVVMDEENRNLISSRERLLTRIDEEDRHYHEYVEREKRLEAQIDASQNQLKFLEGLDASFEGYESGVRELLTKGLPGTKGIVADLVRVNDAGSVALVEKVLGPAVQTVVFDTDEHLLAAVNHVRAEKAGTACMVSLERLSRYRAEPSAPADGTDIRALLQPAPGFEELCEHLLAGVVITESGEQALSLSRDRGSFFTFVGRDGVICRTDGTVIAGESKKEQAGILQRKLQIEQLALSIDRAKKEHTTVLHDKDIGIINRDEAKKALCEIDERLNKGQRNCQEQQTAIRHYETELQTIGEKAHSLHSETTDLTIRIEALETEIALSEAGVAAQQSRYDELESRVETARAGVRSMEDERRAKTEHLKNAELEAQGLANRLSQDRQDVERLTKDNERNGERKRQKTGEKQRSIAEMANLEQSAVSLKEEQDSQIDVRAGLEKARDAVREEYNGRLIEIEELR
ncbi:MAG: chromosome segregation protein SMC, partial [Chitinispirillaceae bacterium]|nr:chromosome segregation protein SMC [Chitinispirillaceae bacterium]